MEELKMSGVLGMRRGTGGIPAVPRTADLGRILSFGTQMSPRTNAGALEQSVQEIMDQFSPLAHEFEIERPRDIGVRVRRDLPMLASGFDFEVMDSPKETKRLNDLIQKSLGSGKYAVTEKEWRGAARALEPFVREGSLKALMNLGVANGPGIRRSNMRDAIVASLWLAGLVTAPQSADFSSRRNLALQLRPLGEMAVAGQKQAGKVFGVGGPQLARALPFVDIYSASVGLRSGPLNRGNPPLTPELFGEAGVFQPVSRIIRKDLRAEELARSGVNVRLARRNVAERAREVHELLKKNLSAQDQIRVVDLAGLDARTYAELLKKDPALAASKVLSALRSPEARVDLALPPGETQRLADEIQEAVSVKRSSKPVSTTRLTKVAVGQGRASLDEAMRELKRLGKKLPGAHPSIIKGLGPAPFVLALASIISAGLAATTESSGGNEA